MDHNLLALVYLHSLGFSQRALSRIFETRSDYGEVYDTLSRESLAHL